MAGSRWEMFSERNFTGKASWLEFYQDGTVSVSWGTGHTWDIIPPNILHFTHNNNLHIYLDIDVASKTGHRNAERNKGNSSVRLETRISGTKK